MYGKNIGTEISVVPVLNINSPFSSIFCGILTHKTRGERLTVISAIN